MNYFTSDFHFGESDERLNLYGRDRLGLTAREFDEMMITQYNKVVKDDDKVYINGDFCKTSEYLQTALRLKGYKILIKGNYDEQFSDEELLKYFQEVHTELTIDLQDGTKVFINHYPVKGNSLIFNLVGHVHSLWQVQRNMINLSVDAWNFAPISEDEICFKINAIKKFYDSNVFVGENPINTSFKQVDKKIIIPSDTIDEKDKLVFLAGPIRGSENWRKQFIYSLNKVENDFVVANPQWRTENFNLPNQMGTKSYDTSIFKRLFSILVSKTRNRN